MAVRSALAARLIGTGDAMTAHQDLMDQNPDVKVNNFDVLYSSLGRWLITLGEIIAPVQELEAD